MKDCTRASTVSQLRYSATSAAAIARTAPSGPVRAAPTAFAPAASWPSLPEAWSSAKKVLAVLKADIALPTVLKAGPISRSASAKAATVSLCRQRKESSGSALS